VEAPEVAPEAPPTTELRHGEEGIGWLESLDGIEVVETVGDETLVALPFYREEGRRAIPIHARVSTAGLESLVVPVAPPAIRTAVHHRLALQYAEGTPPTEVRCGEIEVLAEEPARTRVRVRERGVVLEGWVEGAVAPRGEESCPPRVMRVRPAQASLRGQPPAPPEPLPEGFVEVRDVEVKRRGSVWWRLGGDEPRCERWKWRREGSMLERRTAEARAWYEVREAEGAAFTLYGPGWESTRPNGSSGGFLCAQPIRVVDAADDRWVVVTGERSFVAYHRDDVQHWFLSEQACLDALGAPLGAWSGC